MNIGLCGNIDSTSIARALDGMIPGCDIITGEPGAYADELVHAPGGMRSLDICVIVLDWTLLAPVAFSPDTETGPLTPDAAFQTACEHITVLVAAYRAIHPVPILLFSPLSPPRTVAGMIDRLMSSSGGEFFARCQHRFNQTCRSLADVYPVDVEELAQRAGKDAFDRIDAPVFTPLIARRITDIVVQITKGPLKCMVLDCDGTLWGGSVGEDGKDGIVLGDAGPGLWYRRFQETIRAFHRQGVILALCSRNNTCDVLETIQDHPHMLLRPDMISCHRINWDDKFHSVRGIAAELGIGLDSLLFVDNDPAQRAMIRTMLPDVTVLDLPCDPARYADALLGCSRLWPLSITAEDRNRGVQYAAGGRRRQAQETTRDPERFLRDSHIRAQVSPATPATIDRITQLLNKTNQFNLTGRRYSQSELEALMSDTGSRIYCMSMIDDWGDYGIICAAVIRSGVIEALAMSCRVLGRHAEHAFVWVVAAEMKKEGVGSLTGIRIKTARNAMTEGFYAEVGFDPAGEDGTRREWRIDLGKELKVGPGWIEMVGD